MLATHLADTSAWAELHRTDVAARLVSLLVGGAAATCGLVDLQVLATIDDPHEYDEALLERRMFPRAPIDDAVLDRAVAVGRMVLGGEPVPEAALIVAAAAERSGLVLLHADDAFDRIAAVTGQPVERVA